MPRRGCFEEGLTMIVVKIELWPHGDAKRAKTLGTVAIANDGTGTPDAGNYRAALSHAGIFLGKRGAWKRGYVTGFRRNLSPYHLVKKAIEACLNGKGGDKASSELVEFAKTGVRPGEAERMQTMFSESEGTHD